MKRYYFRIYQCGDEDGCTIWQSGASRAEAEAIVKSEYHSIDQLIFLREE